MVDEKPYHHPDLRAALLEAGVEELREHGIAGFSLRNLAARIGVSHAAPYRHFRNKRELLTVLMMDGMRDLTERLKAAEGNTPRERLNALGRAYITFARERPECHALVFSASGLSTVDREYASRINMASADMDAFVELERAVAACQANGDLDPQARTDALAMVIWSTVYGLATLLNEGMIASMSEARGMDGQDAEREILKALDASICGGLSRI